MAYFWYFLGYGFLGYLLEKLFAALTHAEHRVRKGFLLAPVCPVYGLAMCAVLALGADRIGPLWELALLCSITATTAEYAVHLFCDAVLGVRFWDYSAIPFNLGGRINLLYCFFWGIAAVTWIRYGYPLVAKGMKAVKRRIRPWMTALLAVFMAVNLVTSALALARYDARTSGEAPKSSIDMLLDAHFDDARMERIYPNAKKVIKAE